MYQRTGSRKAGAFDPPETIPRESMLYMAAVDSMPGSKTGSMKNPRKYLHSKKDSLR
jgi:hypothetical protein